MSVSENELDFNQLYAKIIDQAPDCIITLDLNLKVLHVNGQACRELGYTEAELLQLNLSHLDAVNDDKMIQENIMKLQEKGILQFESIMVRKDGSYFPVEVKASLMKMGEKDYLICFARDISDRKQMAQSLQEEKVLMDALMDNIPDSIFFKDDQCRLIRINRKLMHDLGFNHEEEAIGKTDIDLFGEEFGKKTMAIDKQVIQTGKPSIGLIENRVLENGELVWTLTSKVPMFDQDGKVIGITGVAREINEIKKTENELRIKESQLSIASEIAGLGYWEFNPKENLFTFNDHFYKIFHTTGKEVGTYRMSPEEYAQRFLLEEDHSMVAKEVAEAMATKDANFSRKLEHRIKYPDGGIGYIAVHFFAVKDLLGQTIKTYGANQNITERKLAELALKESELTLQKAFEIAAIGSCKYSIKHDSYDWSSKALDVIGFQKNDIPKNFESFLKFVHPEDVKKISAEIRHANVVGLFDLEHRIFVNDQWKWIRFRSHLEYDEKGSPINSIGIIKDITDRKVAENELLNYRNHLEHLVKERTIQLEDINKDLEAFAYSISHDLRAPLRHINGFSNILKRRLHPISPDAQNYIALINDASNRMGTMIDGLLNFSRLGRQKIHLSSVDLNKLVAEVINSIKPDFENRKINWVIESLPTVKGDSNMLRITFQNLIANALKYTRHKETAVIEIGTSEKKNRNYTIYIKDNGVGFNMAYANKLFGVFQRLHKEEEFEGTGIGLAIVHQIIKKHGGSISAESEENKGTTFYIKL